MHLAIHTEFLHDNRSGLGHFTISAISALVEARPDWRITIVANSSFEEMKAFESEKVRVLAWDAQPLLQLCVASTRWIPGTTPEGLKKLFSRLWSLAPSSRLRAWGGHLPSVWERLEPDVIWAPYHTVGQPRLGLYRNLATTKAPVVMTIHDLHPLIFPYEWSPEEHRDFADGFCALARESKLVITQTRFQREDIIGLLGIPTEKVLLKPYPPLIKESMLESGLTKKQRRDWLTTLGVERPYIFYPSSQTRTHKNHARLFLAWRKLKDRMGERCPLLVGTVTQPYHASLVALIDALDLQHDVHFVGAVDDQSLFALYQECNAVIVPSLYEGGGAGPLTEAIMFNRPVLCSDIGPFREQVEFLNVKDVLWFSPTEVDEIVERLCEFLESPKPRPLVSDCRHVLETRASQWKDWAEFYVHHLEQSTDRSHEGSL